LIEGVFINRKLLAREKVKQVTGPHALPLQLDASASLQSSCVTLQVAPGGTQACSTATQPKILRLRPFCLTLASLSSAKFKPCKVLHH